MQDEGGPGAAGQWGAGDREVKDGGLDGGIRGEGFGDIELEQSAASGAVGGGAGDQGGRATQIKSGIGFEERGVSAGGESGGIRPADQ